MYKLPGDNNNNNNNRATEDRKHKANDAKFDELGCLCVTLVTETYGAWGKEATEAFSQLASQIATLTCRPKSVVLSDIYGSRG